MCKKSHFSVLTLKRLGINHHTQRSSPARRNTAILTTIENFYEDLAAQEEVSTWKITISTFFNLK
ncbi:hypothetical protein Lal_00037886 [Lupinus albus]|nr:hypothetical protein Lal_00037886 [Lupinus albus]